jgi:hypothetical protein
MNVLNTGISAPRWLKVNVLSIPVFAKELWSSCPRRIIHALAERHMLLISFLLLFFPAAAFRCALFVCRAGDLVLDLASQSSSWA